MQYLDPGASSVLVQVILAGVVGVLAIVRLYWSRIRGFFTSFRKSSRGGQADQPGP